MKLAPKTAAAVAGAALLVALGVAVSFWAFHELELATAERKHTRALINRGNLLLGDLIGAENAQRGFRLTGDPALLAPYQAVPSQLADQLATLRRLTRIAAAQQHLDALAPLLAAKLAELARTGAAPRALGDPAAPAPLLEAIRTEMRAFIQIEEANLLRHESLFQANLGRLFALFATASLFTLLLVLAFSYFIYRESRHRLKSQVLIETQHLLARQQETNRLLQHANLTLQVSEERLAVTLHSIGDGVIATDATGNVTLLNPLAERLTGWTQAEAAGRPAAEVFHIIHPDTRLPATLPLTETLAHGTLQDLANHTLLVARDGRECAIADSCAAIRDREGRVVGAVLVFRDVTQEDAARLQLRDSAALIQTILNTVGDGIITLRASDGIIARTNPAVERMFGYAPGDLIGRNFDQLIPGLDHNSSAGSLENYRASVEAQASGLGRAVQGRRQDGGIFPVEITLGEMSLGGARFFTGILRDNTARQQVEVEREQLAQRLRDQQFYSRSLFEANIDALMTTDPAGVITDVNKQMEALTGSTRDELIGAPFMNCFTDPERAENSIRLVLAEKKITNYELTARARDGQETVVSYNATTFYDRERRLQGVFAAARDVTARKMADEHLRLALAELNQANANLAHSSRLKDAFLANMSHELRTPLNAILGLSESLLEQITDPLTPRQIRSLTTIATSGQHLLALINDILDLSKIEAGRLELNPAIMNVAEFCQSCLALVRPQARQKQIDVTLEYDGHPATVTADPTRLKQVLVNLLANAVKFTPAGGRIGLTVAAPDGGEQVQFAVWDTGIGIAQDDTPRLFHPFTQIDSGLNRAQEGAGLGLALVAKLVDLQGGNVSFETAPGKGSRFTVTLGRSDVPAPAGAAASAPGAPGDAGSLPRPGSA